MNIPSQETNIGLLHFYYKRYISLQSAIIPWLPDTLTRQLYIPTIDSAGETKYEIHDAAALSRHFRPCIEIIDVTDMGRDRDNARA